MRRVSRRGHERLGPKLQSLAGLSPPRRPVRPPGLPASRPPAPHPPQALVPRLPPYPGPIPEPGCGRRRESTGKTTRRAERDEGLRGRRARAQQVPVHAARAGFSPGWEDRGATARLPRPPSPQPRPGPIRLALSGLPSLPRLSLIGCRESGGSWTLRWAGLPAR